MSEKDNRDMAATYISTSRKLRGDMDAYDVLYASSCSVALLCAKALARGSDTLAREYAAIYELIDERLWRTQRLRGGAS